MLDMKCNIIPHIQQGVTALFMACQNGHLETVKVLLDAGANTELQPVVGKILLCDIEVD